jgi:glycosyltransferase involved in cell wall biosynthesis
MSATRFSVLIPTYQRRDVVVESVRALAAQEGAEPFEVLVVVDGSTDGTAQVLRELDVDFSLTVVEQPNSGSAAARNRGAREARGEILLFLDDDMEAHPRLLAEHDRSHREGADVVFGHIPLHPRSPETFLAASVGEWAEGRRQALVARGGRLELTDFLTGQMSLRRDVFFRLDGFDEHFTRGGSFGGADFDFGRRLVDAGYKLVFNSEAISYQRYVVTPERYLKQWRDNGRARVNLARKHPDLAATLLTRRESAADRLLWRWLRAPVRALVLAAIRVGSIRPWTIRWFFRVQDLEYFAGVREAGGAPVPGPVRVLCYHAVTDLKGAGGLEPYGMPSRRFARQIKLLARFFNFIDQREFLDFLDGGWVPPRAVLVTFDDGLADLWHVALPVLREHGAPAVSFVVSSLLGRFNDWSRERRLALLDADGLRSLAASGITIGVHTRSHAELTKLPESQVREEIEGSISDLEALGFPRPVLLAYPYGSSDATAARIAAEAGLAGAFTTKLGMAKAAGDRFELPRIEIVRRDRGWRFIKKVVCAR